ncbi:MAG TPA: hypothetical protein VFY10_09005 [Dehalococcoidia bacterium]|nr:hypothetical protein [Dehalococcoidia bacterium]
MMRSVDLHGRQCGSGIVANARSRDITRSYHATLSLPRRQGT